MVGGGPAGMEAARVCALKGHDVTLYEKRELGGALIEASLPEFKAPDLKPLVAYLKTQVKKTGVRVISQEATLADLTGGKYGAVIVAAGATPLGLEDIPGITDPKVVAAADVLHGRALLGEKVAVIGGGIVGTEVGLVIAEGGRQVIFIEMLDEFMCNITFDERQVYEERFKDLNVSINTGSGAWWRSPAQASRSWTTWGRRPRSQLIPWCWRPVSGPTATSSRGCGTFRPSGWPKWATASGRARSTTPSTTGIWPPSSSTPTSDTGGRTP